MEIPNLIHRSNQEVAYNLRYIPELSILGSLGTGCGPESFQVDLLPRPGRHLFDPSSPVTHMVGSWVLSNIGSIYLDPPM